jgi:hypothetical protein
MSSSTTLDDESTCFFLRFLQQQSLIGLNGLFKRNFFFPFVLYTGGSSVREKTFADTKGLRAKQAFEDGEIAGARALEKRILVFSFSHFGRYELEKLVFSALSNLAPELFES